MTIRLFLLACLALPLAACQSNKSSAKFYEGDAPTIRYHDRQAPGSRVESQTFR